MKLSNVMYILGLASIVLSATSYGAGKTDDGKSGDEKESTGLFVGFWPPTFFILGKIIEDRENKGQNILTGE